MKAQASGRIVGVRFAEGRDVRAGDLLFQIDPRPYRAALAQAAGRAGPRRGAGAERGRGRAARGVRSSPQGILSREQHEQIVVRRQAARRRRVAADAAAVENARLSLAYTEIRAPIAGRTGSVLVHVGNVVKAGDDSPLVVINRVDPIYVTLRGAGEAPGGDPGRPGAPAPGVEALVGGIEMR